jgi:hypothetical protein
MLGSITPLGERARHSRWGLTVGALVIAATLAGTILGGALGGLGALLGAAGSSELALIVLGAALLAALTLDLGLFGLRIPTPGRQVDDRWLYEYRGWVTGAGFGFQLGLGVVTVVTTALTYVTYLAAALSGSVAAGALIGGLYGAVRGLSALGSARVDSTERLIQMEDRLNRWEAPARRVLLALQAIPLALVVVVVVVG